MGNEPIPVTSSPCLKAGACAPNDSVRKVPSNEIGQFRQDGALKTIEERKKLDAKRRR